MLRNIIFLNLIKIVVSINGHIEEVRGVGDIYTAFSSIFHVEFCYNKTILNVIGSEDDKKELHESSITIGGVDPNYDEESIHIGLVMNEDLSTTSKRNVQERIKKTKKVLPTHYKNSYFLSQSKPK